MSNQACATRNHQTVPVAVNLDDGLTVRLISDLQILMLLNREV